MGTELEPEALRHDVFYSLAFDFTGQRIDNSGGATMALEEFRRVITSTVDHADFQIMTDSGVLFNSTLPPSSAGPARDMTGMLLFLMICDGASEMCLEVSSDSCSLHYTIKGQEYEWSPPRLELALEIAKELEGAFGLPGGYEGKALPLRVETSWKVFARDGEQSSEATERILHLTRTERARAGVMRYIIRTDLGAPLKTPLF